MKPPLTECDEVADNFPLPPRRLTFDEALAIVRSQMPDESETILSNIAERLRDRSRAEHPPLMKAADVSAARINMVLRHKSSGRVYKTILNQQGYSWMQVRNGKLVVNARQYRNGQPYGPIRLIDPEHYVEDILP